MLLINVQMVRICGGSLGDGKKKVEPLKNKHNTIQYNNLFLKDVDYYHYVCVFLYYIQGFKKIR